MEDQVVGTKSMKDVVLKWGGILAAIEVVLSLLFYVLDETLLVSMWRMAFSIVLAIIIGVMAVKEMRAAQGGYIAFGNAFLTAFLTFAFYAVIILIFSLILYFVIDPELPARMTEQSMENTIALLESMGMPEDQMDEAIEEARQKSEITVTSLVTSIFGSLVFYAIIALIIGGVMKRKRPEYEV